MTGQSTQQQALLSTVRLSFAALCRCSSWPLPALCVASCQRAPPAAAKGLWRSLCPHHQTAQATTWAAMPAVRLMMQPQMTYMQLMLANRAQLRRLSHKWCQIVMGLIWRMCAAAKAAEHTLGVAAQPQTRRLGQAAGAAQQDQLLQRTSSSKSIS